MAAWVDIGSVMACCLIATSHYPGRCLSLIGRYGYSHETKPLVGFLQLFHFMSFDFMALSWCWFAFTRALPGLAGSSLERYQSAAESLRDQLLPTFPGANGLIVITSQTSNPITVHCCHVKVIMLVNEAKTQNQTIA